MRARPASLRKRDQKQASVLFQTSQDTDASAPAKVSSAVNHCSGVQGGARAGVEQHATQVALANGLHDRCSDTPVILGGGAQLADQRRQPFRQGHDLAHAPSPRRPPHPDR